MVSKLNLLSTFAILGFSQLITTEAQLNLTAIGNGILGNPAVNWGICSSISFITTVFRQPIEALLNNQISGTNETIDVPPYEAIIITQLRDTDFNGCSFKVTVDFELKYFGAEEFDALGALIPNPNTGFTTITGIYEPGLTFFASDDTFLNGWFPGVQGCVEKLNVDELEIENEGATYEEPLRIAINEELGDPECSEIYPGEEEEDENEDEEDGENEGLINDTIINDGGINDGGIIDGGIIDGFN